MSTLKLPGKISAQPTATVAAPAPVADAPAINPDLVQPAPTPNLNPRNRAMADIAARSNAQADLDAKDTVPTTDEAGNIIEAAPAPAAAPVDDPDQTVVPTPGDPADGSDHIPAPAAPVAAADAAPAAPVPGIDPNLDYEFVVEGKPVKFKGAQIISRVQKDAAADYKLELASKILTEAQATRQAQPAPAPAPAPAAAPVLSDMELAERVQFGTREQAAEAIAEIRRRDSNAVTPEGLQAFVGAQVPKLVDAQIAFREATQFAEKEYGDLLKDPYLKPLFFMKDDQARKAGDKRSYVELWTEIGNGLRTHFNRPKPGAAGAPAAPTPPAAVPTLAQRQAAKAAAPAAPRLASARMEGGDAQAKPKSREEVIEGMRTSRGQNSLNRH